MKRFRLLIVFFIITIIGIISIIIYNKNNNYITSVLKQESYSYLPLNAKEYVQQVFEETGEVLLTEKNKKENVPYLNPEYITYLELSEKEKNELEIIPEPYIIEYDYTKAKSGEDLPESYDLRNYDYITPLKNQKAMGICWTFAAAEQAESYLMTKNSQAYNSSTTKVFSPRQIDYATSSNGIKEYTNKHAFRVLGGGGNFYMASEIMSYGLSLIDEASMPFTTDYNQKELSQVLNYTNSNYEVNNTIDLPIIYTRLQTDYADATEECSEYPNMEDVEACLAGYVQELKDSYIEQIKIGVRDYGGAIVETVAPGLSCGFKNIDNTYAIAENSSCHNINEGHAMHVIGWNDNYSYKYCKGSNKNTDIVNNTCPTGSLVQGKGAFLLRNSWGDSEYAYVYLTYDSINDSTTSSEFHFITNMTETNNKEWDNSYFRTFNYDEHYIVQNIITESFEKNISTAEKLEVVKFNTWTVDAPYSIRIVSGDNVYKYNNIIETNYPGIYTIDLSDKNIILNEDSFSIEISTNKKNAYALNNSISAFTSNVVKSPVIESIDLKEFIFDEPEEHSSRIRYNTKNIPSGSVVNITLENIAGADYTNYLTVDNNVVAENNINASVTISTLPPGNYKLVAAFDNYRDEIPITVKGNVPENYNVIYYSNNGTNESTTVSVDKSVSFTLIDNPYTKTGYKFTEWNTKADGSGDSYSDCDTISEGITSDLALYARWSPITYKLAFNANGGTGTMNNMLLTYDTDEALTKNTFTRDGYIFKGWNTKADGSGTTYQDEESIVNLTSTENETITLYAEWESNEVLVSFNANGGTGTMEVLKINKNEDRLLPANEFIRVGYNYVSWNTKADGSGTTYLNGQEININNNIELYAQWTPIQYKIIFNSNNEINSMTEQALIYDQSTKLIKNTFTWDGHVFKNWNTKIDGSGTTYQDEESIVNLTSTESETITLYAEWEESKGYTINGYDVDEINSYINKIMVNTEANSFTSHIMLEYGYGIDVDYKTINNKQFLYTGGKTRITHGLELYKEYTNVVIGDINGDAAINSADLLKVRQHLLDKNILSGIYFLSSDINYDNTINSADLLRIRQHLLGVKPID